MRRILYLITELDVGGAEKTLYELVTRLDRRRFEPVVACLTGRGPIGEWLAQKNVPVEHVGMTGLLDLAAWFRLRRIIKERRPHVLHTFLFHANVAGRIAAAGLGLQKVIASVRVEEPRRLHLWAERLTRGLADVVTCVSESARQYTHRHGRVALDRLVTIPNGIDPTRYDALPPAPSEWNLPDDAPVIGVIGRLDEQKAPLLMLRTAALTAGNVPNAIFVFAGDGPLAAPARAEAERLGLARNVRWVGWQADIRPLLGRMDVLALGSLWEGMPNVVLEAMAARKPVVATPVGGTAELVVEGETGYLVPPRDPECLAQRLTSLLNDPDLRNRMGQAGRARVERSFTLDRMVAANEALYA